MLKFTYLSEIIQIKMKKLIFSVLLITSFTAMAQNKGIEFLNDTVLDRVLSKAKAENKLVFIDCYAVWCGPCKFMANNIFIDETVGKFHNSNFINLKYDMEKPYGMKIKQKYQVKGYPTYLYLDTNGEVIHRGIGSTPDAAAFLEISKTATNGDKNFRSVVKKLNQGDRTAATLKEYLTLNYRAANTDSLLNDHFRLTSYDEKFSPETWELYKEHLNNPDNQAFQFFISKINTYKEKFGNKAVNDKLWDSFTAIYRATPDKYEALKEIDNDLFVSHKRFVKFSVSNSKYLKDKTDIALWKEFIATATDYLSNNEVKPSQLNTIAWTIFENYKTFKDKAALKLASEWSKRSMTEEPENPAYMDTFAHIQYDRGDKKNAIFYQERAIRTARDKKSEDVAEMEESLKKFQGKKK